MVLLNRPLRCLFVEFQVKFVQMSVNKELPSLLDSYLFKGKTLRKKTFALSKESKRTKSFGGKSFALLKGA